MLNALQSIRSIVKLDKSARRTRGKKRLSIYYYVHVQHDKKERSVLVYAFSSLLKISITVANAFLHLALITIK